jgi:hypothetical protein
MRRRRSLPRILVGALAAVLGAVVFGAVGLRNDPGVDVLAVARPVTAGAVITDADLRVVHLVPDPALQVFLASQRSTVVGRVAAVPLAAGSLLTAGQLGTVVDPPAGQSVIAVGVKTGHAPVTALAAGASVMVLVIPTGGGAPLAQASAVVRSVEPTDTAGVTVVTLQLAAVAAVQVASASGEVSLVLQSAGR